VVLTRALAGAVLAVSAASCASSSSGASPGVAIALRTPITLLDTAGAAITLPGDFARAPLTAVVFYSEHCPTFRAHEARLRDLARAYEPKGVRLVLVDSEVSATAAGDARAAAERGLPAIALDPGARLADALGAEYATYAAVFDAAGVLRYRGGVDSDRTVLHADASMFLRDALDDLLAGHAPRVAEGKVLGCALQRR
jgi:hypothetical protein